MNPPQSTAAIPSAAKLKHPVSGIVPPVITPLLARDQLDIEGLERLIEHLIRGGVHGLFLLGSSAEAPNLSYRLRREVVQRACQVNAGRLPVLVGVTDTSLTEALDLSDYAAEAGAQAIVTATPFYFPVDQTELIRYVEKLVAELPLPLFLYNNPALTRGVFEYDTVRRLAGDERIIGMKDSSGDLAYYQRIAGLRRVRPDFSVLIGPEGHLLESLRLGGCGGINGGANVYPQLFARLYEAAVKGDTKTVAELEPKVKTLGRIYSLGTGSAAFIKGMKCACSLVGICGDLMTEPLEPLGPAHREQVRATLRELGLVK